MKAVFTTLGCTAIAMQSALANATESARQSLFWGFGGLAATYMAGTYELEQSDSFAGAGLGLHGAIGLRPHQQYGIGIGADAFFVPNAQDPATVGPTVFGVA